MFSLITTPSCPNCPQAKRLLEDKGVKFQLVDASRPEGLALARQHGVSHVPMFLELAEDGSLINSWSGVAAIQEFLDS